MPTARELLQQADALMRRDRDALAAGEHARPWSTPTPGAPRPLAEAVVSPRTIQREPIAPSVARTSLPVHPADSPAVDAATAIPVATTLSGAPAGGDPEAAAALQEPSLSASTARGEPGGAPVPPPDAASAMEADFPVLTHAVADVVDADEAAPAWEGVDSDGVPLLTDAVEPLDVVEAAELDREKPMVRGLDLRGEAGMPGRGPDSVAPVPPLDRPPPPPFRIDPLGLDRPAPGFAVSPSLLVPPLSDPLAEAQTGTEASTGPGVGSGAHELPESPGALASASATEPAAQPWGDDAPSRSERPAETPPPDAVEPRGSITVPQLQGETTARAAIVRGGLAGFAPLGPQPGYAVPSALDRDETGAAQRTEAFDDGTASPTGLALAAAVEPEPVPLVATSVVDDARVAEAVDEIRMQMLQRIDIFTDTTLRAELGERLQPLVEKASAELAAAINQHVVDLLRTYVAEALEKEIERWRSGAQ